MLEYFLIIGYNQSMDWVLIFTLPAAFLALIILLYYLARKSPTFKNLKSLSPFLFGLFFLSLLTSVLKLDLVTKVFYSEELIYILDLIILFLIMIFSVRFISFLLFDFLFSYKQSIKYPRLIKDLTVILLYVIGLLLIAKHYLNIRVTEVLASAAVLTVVAGFALQDILGDLFSGIALNLEESLKSGDWVKFGEFEGRIEQLRWRSIKIKTMDNVLVVIPNQSASKEAMKNFGHAGESFALRSQIGVSYKNSPDQVIKTLLEVMLSIDAILKEPAPQVLLMSFDDFSILYEAKYHIRDYSQKNIIHSEFNRKAWYAFKRNNIEIPFPIRDVYIKKTVEDRMADEAIIATLKSNEILGTIDEEQLRNLLVGIEINDYARGELLIHEGETGRCFYHILSGEVEIQKNNKVLNTLGANDYFGEGSLFTGEKTTADVRVSKECRVLMISPERFKETVKMNHRMAKKLSEVIARRQAGRKAFDERESEAKQLEIKKETESIFLRIKKYFSV
jgi:small-conductance mechanosensitive channel